MKNITASQAKIASFMMKDACAETRSRGARFLSMVGKLSAAGRTLRDKTATPEARSKAGKTLRASQNY